ncbi:MAG: ComEC/Rec2 family competence protein [Timaviella obliquedivisa GSE-PSE-MK23-08B]|jgi:competence protein ComEC|nr:ComEC/Rec2 family competence protein [Timaviella obliquedivisa GSE-PSE-MK23-08B]
MVAVNVTVCCLAYVMGLLLTGLPWKVLGLPVGAVIMLLLGAIASTYLHRIGIKPRTWLLAGLCGCLAVLYFHGQLPQPGQNDISRLVNSTEEAQVFTVEGKIASSPRVTRSQRVQFELDTDLATGQVGEGIKLSQVSGKVYVTVPRSQDSQLYPGRTVRIQGSLYKPNTASNPGGFNFQQYLAQQGIFAGLNGKEISFPERGDSAPFLWTIQQRIIQSQAFLINADVGHLISAMVMGRGGVDIAYEIQDQFARVGLAHALAASGTQVSLLAGIVLALTQGLNRWLRLGIGLGILAMYVGLTGIEPSVMRAALMGAVVFLAVTLERQVKPLSLLLMVATLLLLWNPIWIWSLGFQLSFLATLGLVVTVPKLTQWLDWVPTRITPLIAVPIAAYLWTLPLQLSVFGVVSPYCILINIFSSLLITLISVGGMISALLALIHPVAGSVSAWLVHFPAVAFLKIAELGDRLPGNAFAVGTISPVQVLLLYGIYLLVWWQPQCRKQAWLAGIIGLGIVAVPVAYLTTHLSQVTILSTSKEPVMVLRDQGKVGLINVGSESDLRFTVLPFLKQQGINSVDWAIAPRLQASDTNCWKQMVEGIPIRMFYPVPTAKPKAIAEFTTAYRALQKQIEARQGIALQLSSQQKIQSGAITAQLISNNPAILQIQAYQQTWLLLNHGSNNERVINRLPRADVLWWSGEALRAELLEQVQPKVAIASTHSLPVETQTWFKAHPAITLYQTGQDGAVQWTPQNGFKATIEARL